MTRTFLDLELTAWVAEEKEPKPGALPAHQVAVLFQAGARRRWAPLTRGCLQHLDQRELRDLLQEAKAVGK